MWFYGDFRPNEDARTFLAFIERYLFENPHLTEPQKCDTLYNHLRSGWEADNWYEELESSAPEVLTSWPTLRNHFRVKWLSASPSTLLQIPKCKPSIVCTATTTPRKSTINQARRATSEGTKREREGKEEKREEEEERVRDEGDERAADAPGDVKHVAATSRSADRSYPTTPRERVTHKRVDERQRSVPPTTDARPPNSTTTTTTSQTNRIPPARTQTDAKKGVSEVEGTRERVTKDVRTAPSSLANDTPLSRSPTIRQRPTSPKPTVVSSEDRVANPAANEGVREARIEGTKDGQKSSLDWAKDVDESVGISPVSTDTKSTVRVEKPTAESPVVPTPPAAYGPRDLSALCSGTRNPWGTLSRRHHRHHHRQSPRDPSDISSATRTPWNEDHRHHHHIHPSPPPPRFAYSTPIHVVETVRHPQGISPTKPVIRTTSPVRHDASRAPVRLVSDIHLPQTVIPTSGHPPRPPPPAIHPAFAAQCHCGAIRRVRQEFGPFWGAPGFGEKFPRLPWRRFRRRM